MGEPCGVLMVDPFAPLPLCFRHSEKVKDWAYRSLRAQGVTALRLAETAESVVYFLRRRDGRIKIGRTSQLRTRVQTLQCEHGPLVLLATEPGGKDRERELHQQFAFCHWQGEWFVPSTALCDYIDAVNESVAA
jgi:hypothetical protein